LDGVKRDFKIIAKPINDVDYQRAYYCELKDGKHVVWAVNVVLPANAKISLSAPLAFKEIFGGLAKEVAEVEVEYT